MHIYFHSYGTHIILEFHTYIIDCANQIQLQSLSCNFFSTNFHFQFHVFFLWTIKSLGVANVCIM